MSDSTQQINDMLSSVGRMKQASAASTTSKTAFVPSPQTQAAMEQQIAAQASQQAQAQAQGAPPALRMEDLAQMIDGGFQQLGQGISQILAMLQSGQLVTQMMQQQQQQAGGGGGGGGEGGGEKSEGGEKKEKKPEGGGEGGEGGGGGGGNGAAPQTASIEQRLSGIEQILQQLTGGGAPAPAPAPMGGMQPGGAPMA